MKKFSITLLAVLLLNSVSNSQTVKLPAEVKVAPGRLAAVTIEWEGDDLKWDVPSDLDVFREYDTDPKKVRLRLIGYTPGKFRLIAIAGKDKKLSEFASCTIVVEGQLPPNPNPTPNPPNPNPPGPTPIVTKAFLVVIEETLQAAKERGLWITDKGLNSYIRSKGWHARIADKDVIDPKTNAPPKDIAPYLTRASGKTLPYVILVDQDGNVLHEGNLPATPNDLLAILKKVGG